MTQRRDGIFSRGRGWLLALGLASAAAMNVAPVRPGLAQDAAADIKKLGPIVLEDFENGALNTAPYGWKEQMDGVQSGKFLVTAQPEVRGNNRKAGKIEYKFLAAASATQHVGGGPNLVLPGNVQSIEMDVVGDNAGNAVAVLIRDAEGETFEYRAPVDFEGAKAVSIPLAPAPAKSTGETKNGKLDGPLTLQAVRVQRLPAGKAEGEILIDEIAAKCDYPASKVSVVFDPNAAGADEGWKTVGARLEASATSPGRVKYGAATVNALKCDYKYEGNAGLGTAYCEYTRLLPAGNGQGTLLLDLYGDGTNNILRFRLADAGDRVWHGTWTGILVNWVGWRTVYIDTRTLKNPNDPDPTATLKQFPVRFQAFVVDDVSREDNMPEIDSGREGELYLGRILFVPHN